MMDADRLRQWRALLETAWRKDQEELRIWRERFPDAAIFIAEEAAALVEGRTPIALPPIVRG